MDRSYWQKQTAESPLFSDLIWSQPENKQTAGKLAIIGGNLHGFTAPANAYAIASQAGIGTIRVLLPDALKKIVGPIIEAGEFAPSTPSGSFSQKALAEMLPYGAWANGILLAGDFGRNSETAIVLEKFAASFSGQLTITKDAADYFSHIPLSLLNRPNTTLVVSLAQLQKIAKNAKVSEAITFSMDLLQLVERLHNLTTKYPASIVVKHLEYIFAAHNGQVSTTKLQNDLEVWRVQVGAYASVWRLQNPSKPFEALTTAIYSSLEK